MISWVVSQLRVIWWVSPSSPFLGPTHFNFLSLSCSPGLCAHVCHSLSVSPFMERLVMSGTDPTGSNRLGVSVLYPRVSTCVCVSWFPPPRAAQAWLPSGPTLATSSALSARIASLQVPGATPCLLCGSWFSYFPLEATRRRPGGHLWEVMAAACTP